MYPNQLVELAETTAISQKLEQYQTSFMKFIATLLLYLVSWNCHCCLVCIFICKCIGNIKPSSNASGLSTVNMSLYSTIQFMLCQFLQRIKAFLY